MAIRRPNLVKWSHRSCALRGSVRRLVSKGSMMRRMIVARVDFPLPCGPINIAIKKGPSDKAAIIVAKRHGCARRRQKPRRPARVVGLATLPIGFW